MKYTPEFYRSPIDLPEKRVGNMEIKHRWIPLGKEDVFVVGQRQAILRGIPAVRAKLTEPLKVHQLLEHHEGYEHASLWMSDIPEELNAIGELLHTIQPRGHVLVGGLGLGILATTVANWPGVEKVIVVERSKDVIDLCAREGGGWDDGPGYLVVHDTIEHYLKTHTGSFDYYLLDTWAGTNEGTWWDDVLPLRRIIRNRFGMKPVIHGWSEDIMQAQIYRALTGYTRPHWYYTYLQIPMGPREARYFLRNAGSKGWEKKYGKKIDQYMEESGRPDFGESRPVEVAAESA